MLLIDYSIIVGSGEDARVYSGSFLRYKLSRPNPWLFMKAANGPPARANLDSANIVQLDYNLDNHFTLYGQDRIDALATFTPDVLLIATSYGLHYDIEIAGEYLYIINEDIQLDNGKKQDIVDFLTYANVMAKEISEQIDKPSLSGSAQENGLPDNLGGVRPASHLA
jgi:hypothetical protein